MRNPDRIDDFCMLLAKLWREKVPDWRFGQLICNIVRDIGNDPFFIEDDKMKTLIEKYFEKI